MLLTIMSIKFAFFMLLCYNLITEANTSKTLGYWLW